MITISKIEINLNERAMLLATIPTTPTTQPALLNAETVEIEEDNSSFYIMFKNSLGKIVLSFEFFEDNLFQINGNISEKELCILKMVIQDILETQDAV